MLGNYVDVAKQAIFTFKEDYLIVVIKRKFYLEKYEVIQLALTEFMTIIYEKTETIYEKALKLIQTNKSENWSQIKENLMLEMEEEEKDDENSLNSDYSNDSFDNDQQENIVKDF